MSLTKGVLMLSTSLKRRLYGALAFLCCLAPAYSQTVSGGDLELTFSGSGEITNVSVAGRDLPPGLATDGFYVRDLRGADQPASPLFEEGFEGSTLDWDLMIGASKLDIVISDMDAYEGTQSLLIAAQQASDPQQGWILSPQAVSIPVTPGKRYRLQAAYKALRGYLSVSAGTFKRQYNLYDPGKGKAFNGIGLLWLNDLGYPVHDYQFMAPFFDQALEWKAVGGTVTVPEGAASVRIVVSANLDPAYDLEGYLVDSVRFFECPSILDPFSGSIRTVEGSVRFNGFSGPIEIDATWSEHDDSIGINGWVKTDDGLPHALDLHVSIPVDAEGWTWPDDAEMSRVIQADDVYRYANSASADSQSNLPVSLYPYGGVFDSASGVAAAVPLEPIYLTDIGYDVPRKCIDICFRLGLDPSLNGTGDQAYFSARLFSFNPDQGFRGIIADYGNIWVDKPEWFTSPHDPSLFWRIRHDDFSGKIGARICYLCDQNDVLALENILPDFVIEEVVPTGSTPPTLTGLLDIIEDRKNSTDPEEKAYYTMVSDGIKKASNGDPVFRHFNDQDFHYGWVAAEFKLDQSFGGYAEYNEGCVLGPAFFDTAYPNPSWNVSPSILDGVYLDNLLMQGAIDFDGEHIEAAPHHTLTYSPNDYGIGLPPSAGATDFLDWTRQWMDTTAPNPRRDITVNMWGIANSNACLPWIDIYTDEVQNVIENGEYGLGRSVNFSPEILRYKRALACGKFRAQAFEGNGVTRKNVLDLMHTYLLHATGASPIDTTQYENPGVFGENQCLLLTDELNILVKMLHAAGWEPLTFVTTIAPDIYLERYGSPEDDSFFVVVLNDDIEPISDSIVLTNELGLNDKPQVFEIRSGVFYGVSSNGPSSWKVKFNNLPMRRSLLFRVIPDGGESVSDSVDPGPGLFGDAEKTDTKKGRKPGSGF